MTTSTLLGASNIFHSTLGNVSFTFFILQLLMHVHARIRIRRIILLQAKWDPTLVGAVWKLLLGLGPHRRSLTVSVADESGSCSATAAVHCDFWRKAFDHRGTCFACPCVYSHACCLVLGRFIISLIMPYSHVHYSLLVVRHFDISASSCNTLCYRGIKSNLLSGP